MLIVVAHPSPVVATGMAAALRRNLTVSASSVCGMGELWEAVVSDHPDFVVLDASLVPDALATVCGRLADRGCKPIALFRSDAEVSHLALLEQGAAGIVLAGDGLAGLLAALRTVMAGHTHVPPHLLGTVLHQLIVERRNQEPTTAARVDQLSPRELEVLALLGHGGSTKEIANLLVISPHTAKTHINRLLGKLGVASRTEAAALAITHGIRSSLLEASHD